MKVVARKERMLIIFARVPRVGTVKSRLAKDIGAVAAWRFYRSWIDVLVREFAQDSRWTTRIAITPDARAPHVFGHNNPLACADLINQGSGDLGERMRRQFQQSPANSTVIIGSDLPVIKREDIWHAFRALRKSDAVFGPSVDGGYWLVGLNNLKHHRSLFDGVRWSTEHALSDTVKTLSDVKISFLKEGRDIDTLEDLHFHTLAR